MEPLVHIDTHDGGLWYNAFYFLALIVLGGFFLVDGYRQQRPLQSQVIMLITAFLGMTMGSILMACDAGDWSHLWHTGRLVTRGARTSLGALTGGLAGLWLASRLLRYPFPVMDAFAVGIPVAMAIQRIGCLLAGCCYGAPADVPWAVAYASGSPAFHNHVGQGLIEAGASASLAVHPSQFYQTLFCLLIALIVWRCRKLFRRAGSLCLFSVALYLAGRFIVEGYRQSDVELFGIMEFAGLRMIRWAVLGMLLVVLIVLFVRERGKETLRPSLQPVIMGAGWLLPVTGYALMWSADLLSGYEQVFFGLPVLGIVVERVMWLMRIQQYRLRPVLALTLLALIAVQIPMTAQSTYKLNTNDADDRQVINELGLSFSRGAFSHYHAAPSRIMHPGGIDICGQYYGPITTFEPVGEPYKQRMGAVTAEWQQLRTYGLYNKFEWAARLSGTRFSHPDVPDQAAVDGFDLSIGAAYDWRWFGMGLDLHAGETLVEKNEGGITFVKEHLKSGFATVSGEIRVFPYDIFYGAFRFNQWLPYAPDNRRYNQLVMGTGLGRKDGTCLELIWNNDGGVLISGKAVLWDRLVLRTSLPLRSGEMTTTGLAELGLGYRFAGKRR